jgi:hypothetical protein
MILYIERWLKAPITMPDEQQKERNSGTPQGELPVQYFTYMKDIQNYLLHPGSD